MRNKFTNECAGVLLATPTLCTVAAGQLAVVFERNGSTFALQAYAPNIIRVTLLVVTLNTIQDSAMAAPGHFSQN